MPRLLSAGQHAILVETTSAADTVGLADKLRSRPPANMLDFLPAEATVMVFAREGADLAALRSEVMALCRDTAPPVLSSGTDDDTVVVPVHYDGQDLERVAHLTGLSVADFIARHTEELWECTFVGFAPGFSYLGPTSGWALSVPRREQSRPSVPPGSVAVAGRYSAVYPRSSPGGWQLVGRTELPMWNVQHDPPALIQPGRHVRFVDADAS